MKVNIAFMSRWKEAMLAGRKTATCRTRAMAQPGDTFEAFGATFLVLSVRKVTLAFVAQECYSIEGVDSPQAYIDVWNQIHKQKGYDPEQQVYLHRFELHNHSTHRRSQ
jgi:uncharacterized protein YqfB (UPF0267 family)